ncbi:hypothetical protein OWR29_15660 [Actinoplanes sp. Pm04-4]|uniref:Uncharacterized protein n=1 Tax=Paractinoplanes pyxinae TaxID=2997416 RepID=A0ABT4B0J4_9ACTN|nr:hypothetical protein [Actinoplanes pyxinae]MCY1139435.1 hypothetical protein [Actinoplanes pyxinae]
MRIWPAVVAVPALLAAAAFVPPAPEPEADPCEAGYSIESGRRILVFCATAVLRYENENARYPVPDAPPLLPYLPSVYATQPSDLRVGGEPACGAGPVGTTEPVTLSAAYTVVLGPPPTRAVFEYSPDYRGLYGKILDPVGRAVLTLKPGELAPGDSVRWRVSLTGDDDRLPIWSPWCTFTVAADAPDLRGLEPDVIAALTELGLRPEREYTVTLPRDQWRTALEPFGIYPTDNAAINEADPDNQDDPTSDLRTQLPGPATLTGAQWSDLITSLAQWSAYDWESYDDSSPPIDPAVYWAVVDEISTQLGGPPHPRLGLR